jgi:hypothetical protein
MLRSVAALHAEAAHDEAALGDAIDLAIDAAQRRHQQRAARRLAALAIEETVTSIVWPTLMNGGRFRCHRHRGHVLQLRIGIGGIVTPNCAACS